MSTAQNDRLFMNGENYGQRNLTNKQFHSDRKHTIRKQALGEIKNVIHNHSTITPFKGMRAGPSKPLCTELLKKQTEQIKARVDNNHQSDHSKKVKSAVLTVSENIKERELPAPRTCNDKCYKGLEEIWSEMNVIEPDILEKLINADSDPEDYFDIPDYKIPPLDLDDATFKIQDPYEMETQKLIENLLIEDYECGEFPLATDWIDDL